MPAKEDVVSRFHRKYRVDPNSGCWVWAGATSKKKLGYGRIVLSGRKVVCAHRLSWEIHFGAIEDAVKVLHSCDNSLCVNPKHLFLGDQKANMSDAVRKGRKGLDKDTVMSVLFGNERAVDVARRLGISQAAVSRIRNRKSYSAMLAC